MRASEENPYSSSGLVEAHSVVPGVKRPLGLSILCLAIGGLSVVAAGMRGGVVKCLSPATIRTVAHFSRWGVLFVATLILNLGVVAGLRWVMGLSDGASLLAASATTFLSCFVIGEFIRGRLQISLRVLLALVTLVALFCGLFGNRLVKSRKEHSAVTTIVQAGGHITYMDSHLEDLGGGWFRSERGWMVPVWLLDLLGREFFADVDEVRLGRGRASAESIEKIDFGEFPDLYFGGTKLNSAVMARLGTLTHLRTLDISATGIDDADVGHLAGLKNLEALGVGYNPQLTEQCLEPISRLPELTTLMLHGSNIRGTWFSHLASFPRLTVLDVSATPITDEDLADIAVLGNLEHLRLDSTSVTDAGLKHLQGLSNLRGLVLSRANLTDSGVSELQRSLPDCRIQLLSFDVQPMCK